MDNQQPQQGGRKRDRPAESGNEDAKEEEMRRHRGLPTQLTGQDNARPANDVFMQLLRQRAQTDLAAEALAVRNRAQLLHSPSLARAQYNASIRQRTVAGGSMPSNTFAGMPGSSLPLTRGVSQPPLAAQNELLRQLMTQGIFPPSGAAGTGAAAAAGGDFHPQGQNSFLSSSSASFRADAPSDVGPGAATRAFAGGMPVGDMTGGMHNYLPSLSGAFSARAPLVVASTAAAQQHSTLSFPHNFGASYPRMQPAGPPGADIRHTTSGPSGGRAKLLYVPTDDDSVNSYQCFARKQIELFEATQDDVDAGAQGRNKPIVLGQVGIRCVHCAELHPRFRTRAAVYYPSRLSVLYQAAQNIVTAHLPELCETIPESARQQLNSLDNKRSSVGGGKNYWCDTAQVQGVGDTDKGLRFTDNPLPPSST